MSPALVISRREIRTYFNSAVAYIVVAAFMVLTGYLFFTQLFLEKQADMRGFFNIMPLMFMFVVPAITMRLLADEKSSGTLELLITMPVRDWEVVVGKFLAAMTLLCTAIGLTLVFALSVRALGPLDRGPAIGGYLGLVLMGGAYVSIGVMASSLTRNPIVSFIVAFVISFGLYLLGRLTQFLPQAWQGLVAYLSIDGHFENIGRGVIDSRDVIYYLSVIAVGLLIATLSLESRRWK
ncbi:MAG TPA: ABC transporter permease subunit [Polyangia bacterium]|nr:ABC transporter permease subunit [Polyangia bacterium]HVY41050.1 ABC transporter permease subunit [Polyangia bacterium]